MLDLYKLRCYINGTSELANKILRYIKNSYELYVLLNIRFIQFIQNYIYINSIDGSSNNANNQTGLDKSKDVHNKPNVPPN